jgi:SAM-dependent methyltransferase
MTTLGQQTIADFGEQWTHFTENEGYYGSTDLLNDLLQPLVDPADLHGKRVADIGSGTGRIVRMLCLSGASHVIAVEPSDAMIPLRANTTDLADRIRYLHAPGDALPADAALDLIVSFGVLHHIPDPDPVVRAAFRALEPGGRFVVWLYGVEGNRLYLALAQPLRRATRRLPHAVLHGLSRALTPPLAAYAELCRWLPLPMRAYMRSHIARLSNPVKTLTIYDQLNPAYAKYYSRAEAIDLLARNGFSSVRAHHRHGYSWTVVGTK